MNETENRPVGPPADPFPTFAALRARHSELLDIDAETDGDQSYLADVQIFFDRVRATGAILSAGEERRATQSILNYWATVLYRADRKPSSTTLVDLDPEFKPKLDDARCPYPGVREFDETEGKYFFGRQRTIDYLLARLKEESFLALVGPSGSGKSSLVRAGLRPAIKNVGLGEDPGEIQRHFFPIMTPGSNPLINLASLLSAADTQPETPTEDYYLEKLHQDSRYLLNFLTERIAQPAVIVVDQFEELFNLCKDGEARRAFIHNLQSLDNSKHRLIVCTTVEDFGDDLKRLPEFEKIFARGRTLLPRLGTSELSDAITKPADLVGFKFKDKTIKDIVQEIGTLPVALPLLQFTLVKLWEKRGEHDEYFAAVGGCRQLLTQSAEEFLSSLEPHERELAEQIFRKMVKFEYKYQARVMPVQLEAHSVPVTLQDLRSESESPHEVDAMVDRMSKAQLIRRSLSATPADAQLELVHDSLVQNWPRLARWVEWQKNRRFRIASVSVAALIILIVVGLTLGATKAVELVKRYRSHDQASRWARASRKHLNDKRLDTAMLLSMAGYLTDAAGQNGFFDRYLFRGETDLQARGALLSTLFFQPAPKRFLEQRGSGDIAFSPDNRLLAANDSQGNIVILDLTEEQPSRTRSAIKDPVAQGGDISPLIFTNSGLELVSGGADAKGDQLQGAVSFWNVASRQQVKKLVAPDIGRIVAVALSRDDKKLAALGKAGGVVIWDIDGGTMLPALANPPGTIQSIALSNSGNILATGDAEGNVVLWDVQRGRPTRTLAGCDCLKQRAEASNVIASIAFSLNDQKLAVSGTEETMLWSLSTQGPPVRLATSRGEVGMILAFSENGETLAGFEGSSQIYLWDVRSDTPKRIGENIFQPIAAAASLAFTKDVKTLASRNEQGITLWDLSGGQSLEGQTADINSLAFSHDNKILASGDEDGVILLRDATSGNPIGEPLLNEQQSSVVSMAFSKGSLLASGLYRGGIILWNVQGQKGQKVSSVGAEVLDQGLSDRKPMEVSKVAFRNDDKTLVSIGRTEGSGELQLDAWKVPEMDRAHKPFLVPLDGPLPTAVAINADGSMLAVAFNSQKIRIWDLRDLGTPKEITTNLSDLGTMIQALEFSANGRWLVFGGKDSDSVFRYDLDPPQTAPIFNAEQTNPTPIFLEGLSGDIVDLSFTSDGRILAVAVISTGGVSSRRPDQPGAVVLVDISEPRVITEPIRGPDSGISTLSFRPDGKFMSTGGQDGAVVLWNLELCEAKERVCSAVNRRSFTPEEIRQHSIPDEYWNACGIEVKKKECSGSQKPH